MVMGCNESRDKEHPPIHFTFEVATPLPLHIYQYAYPIRKSPTSSGSLSPTSLSPTSLSPTSLSPTSLSPTSKASPTSKSATTKSATTKSAATLYYNKLKAIAHYKIPTFKQFPIHVQEQILHHIEKELQGK